MSELPKISVIVLIYNVEQYIEKCVESLYRQSLDSIEYIFIDDCSTDRSIEILRNIMDKYPDRSANSIIVANKSNQGQAKSRMNGIKYAHGKYVIFCDSDDYVARNAYEDMYDYIEMSENDIIGCDFYRVYGDKQVKEHYIGSDTPYEWIKNILLSKKMGALWCHLIKKELLVGLDCPKGNIMEDTVILTQCLLKTNKVSTYKKPLYYYNFRTDSISNNTHKVVEQAMQMSVNMNMISSFLDNRMPTLTKEVECKFFFVKRWLLPIINNTKDCKFWIDFESNINAKIFFNPYISIKDKINSLLIYMRLYPFFKKILTALR